MDGLLVVDKPAGPTSHDVVARVRRLLRERRIGHTGTLDPAATGVLALVLGKATRLAQFLSGSDKSYEAVIRLGFSTDTGDAEGRATGVPVTTALPSRDAIEAALDGFRGTFLQQPPAFSAKKIGGRRSHRLARSQRQEPAVLPAPATVTVSRLEVLDVRGHLVTIDVRCSSGFYVRSLAQDLGRSLGVGAHLTALRRTEAGGHTLDESISLAAIEEADGRNRAKEALVPMADILSDVPRLTLTPAGVRRAVTGCDLGTVDFEHQTASEEADSTAHRVRLLDGTKNLVGIADRTAAGLLHPVVVLM